MTVTDELIVANARYAEDFRHGDLPRRPARRVAILTCLDARIDLYQVLGLAQGQANVIRNAGGRAADAIRSLTVACGVLGVREIVVMHHTDCGLCKISNDDVRAAVRTTLGDEAGTAAETVDFLAFGDLDQSVRDDLALIRSSPLIPDDISVRGFVYHVENGRIREIEMSNQ